MLEHHPCGDVATVGAGEDGVVRGTYDWRLIQTGPLEPALHMALDEVLTRELVRSVRASAHERRVMAGSLSNSDDFGRVGWCRPYPGHVEK